MLTTIYCEKDTCPGRPAGSAPEGGWAQDALQPCPTAGPCEYRVTPWLMLAERRESSIPFAFSRPVPESHPHNRDTAVREENNTLAQMNLQADYNL